MGETGKNSELTYADDVEKRFLRPTGYHSVEEEINDLVLAKQEDLYSFKNIFKVILTKLIVIVWQPNYKLLLCG